MTVLRSSTIQLNCTEGGLNNDDDHEYKQHLEQNHSPQTDIIFTPLKCSRKTTLYQTLGFSWGRFHFTERSLQAICTVLLNYFVPKFDISKAIILHMVK